MCTVTLSVDGIWTRLGHTLELWKKGMSHQNAIYLLLKRYDLDTNVGYMCTVTSTVEIWHRFNVMTYLGVVDNDWEKFYQGPTWQSELRYGQGFKLSVHCDLNLVIITLSQCPVKYCPFSTQLKEEMTRTKTLAVYARWHLLWRYDIRSRSCHTVGPWTAIMWNIQIQPDSKKLRFEHGFGLCDTVTLTFDI